MAASPRKTVRRAFLALIVAGSFAANEAPAAAATTIVGTPTNPAGAPVHIDACSVVLDPKNTRAFPTIVLSAAAPSGPQPISAQVDFTLRDAAGDAVNTEAISVPVAPSDVPLPSYPVSGGPVALGCRLRSTTLSDGTVVNTVATATTGGGGGSGGAALGIIGGLAVLGGLAAAAGHGGSGSSGPAPTQAPTFPPTQTPTPAPTLAPTATPTLAPTATPTAPPTATPAPTPTPTPIATPTAGPLHVAPSNLTFIATGPSYAQSVQASETNFSGTFSVMPASCSGSGGTIASVSPGSTSSGAFTVTPQSAGTCNFTVSDGHGNVGSFTVGVTTTGGTIQAHPRRSEPTKTVGPPRRPH